MRAAFILMFVAAALVLLAHVLSGHAALLGVSLLAVGAILSLPDRDVYIGSGGAPQLGEVASAATNEGTPMPDVPGGAVHAGGQGAPAALGSPVFVWFWIVLAFLAVAVYFQHRSAGETFKNPKVSAIAMLTIWASWAVVQMGMRAAAAATENKFGPNGFSRLVKGL